MEVTSLEAKKQALAQVIIQYNQKGWSPATSTNYSFKSDDGAIWVSRSGVDKSNFKADDFIHVDKNGTPQGKYKEVKPSAETLIHCTLYNMFESCGVVLHSHSVYPVVLSATNEDELVFEGYEVQKGFAGQTTHEGKVAIPIFDNTQDMNAFSELMIHKEALLKNHTLIIRKHGTYAWGKNLFEAKRHLESLEYLCQCEWLLQNNKLI